MSEKKFDEKYDFRLDGPNAERVDEIPATKIFVADPVVSEAEAKTIFTREKVEVFKGFFKRPKETEVEIKKVVKSFEPYFVISGEYNLRYLIERTYDIDLNDNTVSVFILGEEIIVPEEEEQEVEVEIKTKKKSNFFSELLGKDRKKKPKPKPEIQLNGIEHVYINKEIMETLNYNNVSVNPDSLPEAALREVSEQFISAEVTMIPKDYYDIDAALQGVIEEYTQKPDKINRTLNENLKIADKKIIFYPVFWATMIYKGKEEKSVRLDAISKKVQAKKGNRFAYPTTKSIKTTSEQPATVSSNLCTGCGEEVDSDDKFCNNCGVKLN